jgi:hypothetical protein
MGGLRGGRPVYRAWRIAWLVSIVHLRRWGGQDPRGIGAGSCRLIIGQTAE